MFEYAHLFSVKMKRLYLLHCGTLLVGIVFGPGVHAPGFLLCRYFVCSYEDAGWVCA